MKKDEHNHPGKIRPIITIAARMIQKDPTLLDELDAPTKDGQLKRLRAMLKHAIPELADPSKCANCGASMAEYEDRLDINVALLLLNMGKLVRERAEKIPFLDANKIRVSGEPRISHTQKCHTTRASKLGLIAKAGHASWSVTARGFAALRGDSVPRVRITFRGQILERPEELTTLREAFYEHGQKMADRAARRKSMKDDHRSEFSDYEPSDWVHIVGMHQGNLLANV